MSIHVLRETYGLDGITMRYEDGGKVEVYKVGDTEIKFPAGATMDKIADAFKEQK